MLNVNVNVKCKCKCSVYMSDLTTEHYNIYGNSSLSVTLQGIPVLAGKSEDVDQQWTSSSSATYTIAIKHRSYHNSQTEISRKKITFRELVIPLLHPLIFLFLSRRRSPCLSSSLEIFTSI